MYKRQVYRTDEKREGALVCLRTDKESALTDQEKQVIMEEVSKRYVRVEKIDTVGEKLTKETRRDGLRSFFDRLGRAEFVITDRLHGMIFCALEGIPCIALDNSYQKVLGAYEWLKSLEYIHYVSCLLYTSRCV